MTYDIILNVEKSGIKPRIKVSQYDKTLPQIRATLYSNNQAFNIPSGSTVYISGTKKDNTGFKYECTYSNNEITADITEQMTAFSGDVEIEFTIESSGSRKGTENFILEVEPAALEDDVIISETDIPAIQRLSQPATTTQLGVVKVDGTTTTIDSDGTLHAQGGGSGAVQSVNGQTGAVVLDADDIDDTNTTNKFTNATEKQAWNGKSTVSVTQIKSSGEKIATINVNGTDTDLYASAGGGGGGAVDSVNGKTGDVVLTASDVGALADNTPIPSDLSDLSDVDTSGVTDGQILKYNGTSGKFLPSNESGGGTSDYSQLTNKPSINGVTLSGNKTSADLGISGGSNENLLLNPWFNVNTKKFSSTTIAAQGETNPFIDDWRFWYGNAEGSAVTVSYSSSNYTRLTFSGSSGAQFGIKQQLEHNLWYKLVNNTVTVSIWTSLGIMQKTITIPTTASSFEIGTDSNGNTWYVYAMSHVESIAILCTKGSSDVEIMSVKLELGSASTLALDVAPNTNEETVRCNGVMRSNRNLLDNPWFTVNQRGFTSIISANNNDTTLFDRWKNANGGDTQSSTISLGSSGLTLTQNTTTTNPWQICLDQIMEENVISNKVITFSVLLADGTLVKSSGLFNADIINEYDISTNLKLVYGMWTYNGKVRARIGIRTPQSYSQSASVTIRAVKLELGTESTLALDVSPNYTEELLKCQRYYVPLPRYWNGLTAGINSTYHLVNIALPTKMRAVPTISGSANIEGALNGASVMETIATSSMTVRNADSQFIQIEVQGSNQFDKNGNVLFMPSSGAALSAEL